MDYNSEDTDVPTLAAPVTFGSSPNAAIPPIEPTTTPMNYTPNEKEGGESDTPSPRLRDQNTPQFERSTNFGDSPFALPVEERDTVNTPGNEHLNDNGSGDIPFEIPDAQYNAPPIGGNKEGGIGSELPPVPGNPSIANLPDSEKMESAKSTAAIYLATYQAYLPPLCKMAAGISQRKVDKLESNGYEGILEVPLNSRENIGQFIESHNATVNEAFAVTNEFIETARPPLERVLAKNNIGMSDESQLLFIFASDLLQKGAVILTFRTDTEQKFNFAKSFYDKMGNSGRTPSDVQQEMAEQEATMERKRPTTQSTSTLVSTRVEDADILNNDEI